MVLLISDLPLDIFNKSLRTHVWGHVSCTCIVFDTNTELHLRSDPPRCYKIDNIYSLLYIMAQNITKWFGDKIYPKKYGFIGTVFSFQKVCK